MVRLESGQANRKQFQADYSKLPGCQRPSGFPESDPLGESDPVARVRIFRTGETSQSASVEFTTIDETAKAGRDYIATSGRVVFAPLEVEREIVIPLIDNKVADGDRQFRVALRQPSAGYIVPTVHASFVIQDDDYGFALKTVHRLDEGRVSLTLYNTLPCGNLITLEASSDLQKWNPIAEVNACERTLRFEDTSSTNSMRFYRLVHR